jgi:hypothetical protein
LLQEEEEEKKGVRGKNEEEKFASSFLPKGERGERGVE